MNKAGTLVAVIDIGSTSIRLVIAELEEHGGWRRVDRAVKQVPLGRDVFEHGNISRHTLVQALRVLTGFCEMLESLKVEPDNVRVIATTAIREARNRDTFIDRVYLRTGLRINVVEGIEENHLTYMAVTHAMKHMQAQINKTNTLIMEIGGGSTEIMLLRRGKMVAAHSLKLGTIRLEQQYRPGQLESLERYIYENVRNLREVLDIELELNGIRNYVAVGGEARLAARKIGAKVDEHYYIIKKDDFNQFTERLRSYSVDDCVSQLRITYNEAEGLVPALLMHRNFLASTQAQELIVPDVSIREGVLLSFALGSEVHVTAQLGRQVIESAINLGRKYRFDQTHAQHVAHMGLMLFDAIADDQGLDAHARLLLQVAALLHDIGYYIASHNHHRHSQYLVANSDIFGISRSDLKVVANVVRYHRKAIPSSGHFSFISLPQEERLLVLKLAAILRVADGLDRGRSQRIRALKATIQDEEIQIRLEGALDPRYEQAGIKDKARLFEEVFGYTVRIVQ